MKIAMVHASLPSEWRGKEGGVTYFVHNLANHLTQRGHDITVFALDKPPIDAKYKVQTISTAHWLHTNRLARYYLVPFLFARLKLNDFELVHTHGDDWLMPRKGIPFLRTFYGSALAEARNSASWKRRFNQNIIHQTEQIAARRADQAVAISQDTLKYFSDVKEVIPCGVDVAVFRPTTTPIKSAEPTILFVGGLEGRKRGRLLVETFLKEIKPKIPHVQLWLVADQAVEGDGIHNFGKVSQAKLIELYQTAWIFCLPSTYEGFGIPYVEAMAAGTPVVATANGGSCEILDNGRYGVICSDENLASALLTLLNDAQCRENLAQNGQQRAEDYDWSRVVAAYEEIYSKMISPLPMKVLAISHSTVVDVNQKIYVELSNLPSVQVRLIAPSRWISEFNYKSFKTVKLTNLNIPFYTLPIGKAGNNSLHFYWLFPFMKLRSFRPDIIFLDEEPWSLIAFQALLLKFWLGCKLVFYTKQNLDKIYPPPFRWFNKWTYQLSSIAFSVANEVTLILRKKGYSKPIHYLPHAIDEATFYPESKPTRLKAELGLAGTFVIGYVGRLIEAKGIQVLVKAVALLAEEKDLPLWKVLLIGDGEYRPTLERLIADFNLTEHFILAGSVAHNQVAQYMNCLDVFVLPSLTTPAWKEQFGRVIIEALACGVPVIGSDSGEIPHLIEATGGGLVAHEGDEVELAKHLKTLLTDGSLRQKFAENGLAAVKVNYTNAGVARRLAEILRAEVNPQ